MYRLACGNISGTVRARKLPLQNILGYAASAQTPLQTLVRHASHKFPPAPFIFISPIPKVSARTLSDTVKYSSHAASYNLATPPPTSGHLPPSVPYSKYLPPSSTSSSYAQYPPIRFALQSRQSKTDPRLKQYIRQTVKRRARAGTRQRDESSTKLWAPSGVRTNTSDPCSSMTSRSSISILSELLHAF